MRSNPYSVIYHTRTREHDRKRDASCRLRESVEPQNSTLSIESPKTFGRLFRPRNLELFEAITTHEPGGIRELARTVDRHPPEVLDNINELVDYGLVELLEEGRSTRPVV